MIEVSHLTKDYGTVVAVRDVSFTVERGQIVGFLGPNGAGKSTTLRVLAGFLGATSGSVTIAGHDVAREPLAARRSLGYMPESAPLYPELRVEEYLAFRAELKEVRRDKRKAAVARAMERAAVGHVNKTLIGHLSKGYRQRVALADALVADPPLLILDEPTAGLDPNQIREVRRLVAELAEDHTILLSTHILSEVEASCQRAIVIDRGHLVAQGSLAELAESRSKGGLTLRVRDPERRAQTLLAKVPGVSAITAGEEAGPTFELEIELSPDAERELVSEELVRTLSRENVGVHALIPRRASLEEVFSALTREQGKVTSDANTRDANTSDASTSAPSPGADS
ncbi:MAG TPA: ABC transporter ATP-binding protein [Polyangiaceae bacterium]|jgi:ABC-2 type transport system ATP-binding protein